MGAPNSMLLTLPPHSAKSEFEFKYLHDFARKTSPLSNRSIFKADHDVLPPLLAGVHENMSGAHRGLPPPASMTLPDPGRIPPPMSSHYSGMPAPPPQWQGAEDSMKNWLMTKAEEEKRKQEEERTRQESFRLEQRKIEQNMLSESIRNGVPPALVPIIFAGIGSSSLSSISIEWLQQYATTLQNNQQQQYTTQNQPRGSPDGRRDRMIGQSQTYSTNQQQSQQLPAMSALQGQQASPGQPPPSAGTQYANYQTAVLSPNTSQRQPSSAGIGPTSAPRPPLPNVLPRLTTNEVQPPSGAPTAGSASHAHQPGPTHGGQEQSQSSPSIYFHHWVPPSSQGSGNPPPTPSEYASSPRKRKAPGAHQTASHHSPSFVHVPSNYSTTNRRAHIRQRSNSPTRRVHDGRFNRNAEYSAQPSHAETDEQNRRRHYPVGGAEDRSDSSSQSSYDAAKRSRKTAEIGSEPVSPKREGGPVASGFNRRSSVGAHGPGS
ncbi:hypothetical protein EJ08DRAFT_663404 [Tothia fuscella]|uniref:Uncharacterized protein n=1 Tax=Tothia fuscella TaxID=1048955 RepID=A0A9P4TW80_9PEZI|nr:hypothetical protein EJ08DRAFT_663404 [Tothia fuscella]